MKTKGHGCYPEIIKSSCQERTFSEYFPGGLASAWSILSSVSQEQENSRGSDKENCKVMLCRLTSEDWTGLQRVAVTFSDVISREVRGGIKSPSEPFNPYTPLHPRYRYVLQNWPNDTDSSWKIVLVCILKVPFFCSFEFFCCLSFIAVAKLFNKWSLA